MIHMNVSFHICVYGLVTSITVLKSVIEITAFINTLVCILHLICHDMMLHPYGTGVPKIEIEIKF